MRLLALVVLLGVGCGRLGFDAVGDDIADPSAPDGGLGVKGDGDGGGAIIANPDAIGPSCSGAACRLAVDQTMFLRNNHSLYPATVSAFSLDRFEVTVARFRVFVEAGGGTQASAPDAGDGAHPAVAGSGWQASWVGRLAPSSDTFASALVSAPGATYTIAAGANDERPVVGVSWYEALAFCIWDGGRLPTFAEHEAAAYGGEQQRPYPWGAIYDPGKVATGTLQVVGAHPDGDARWGHADLVGNADEWALDYFGLLPTPCTDCVNLVADATPTRILLGDSFLGRATSFTQAALLHGMGPIQRNGTVGFRCARSR